MFNFGFLRRPLVDLGRVLGFRVWSSGFRVEIWGLGEGV